MTADGTHAHQLDGATSTTRAAATTAPAPTAPGDRWGQRLHATQAAPVPAAASASAASTSRPSEDGIGCAMAHTANHPAAAAGSTERGATDQAGAHTQAARPAPRRRRDRRPRTQRPRRSAPASDRPPCPGWPRGTRRGAAGRRAPRAREPVGPRWATSERRGPMPAAPRRSRAACSSPGRHQLQHAPGQRRARRRPTGRGGGGRDRRPGASLPTGPAGRARRRTASASRAKPGRTGPHATWRCTRPVT